MADTGQPTTGGSAGKSHDLEGEARVRAIIGDSEKGLMLLEHLKKKDQSELKKLKKKLAEDFKVAKITNGLLQAAYIKSKLAKHTGKPDPLLSKITLLIEQLVRDDSNPASDSKKWDKGYADQTIEEESDDYTQGTSVNHEDDETKRQKSKKKKTKTKKKDNEEPEVIVGRHKKDQFALTHAQELKRLEQQQAMMRDVQEKNRQEALAMAKQKEADERDVLAMRSQYPDDRQSKSPSQKGKGDRLGDKRSTSNGRRKTAAEDLVSTLVRSSPQKALYLVQDPDCLDEKRYKLVAEIIPSREEIKEILAYVKGGQIEGIDVEAKVERDSKSVRKGGESNKKKNRKSDDDTFPMHHYTKELIADGSFEDSFEEWIFDPIISSKVEHKENMMKSKKEKRTQEVKKKLFEEKLKKVKPTDTFYMLNKKRLNLEPEEEKPKNSIHEKIIQSKKQTKAVKAVVVKDMSTFTDFMEPSSQPIAEKPKPSEVRVNKNIPAKDGSDSSREVSKEKLPLGNKFLVARNDDYMAEMEDPDSRSASTNPKPRKKDMPSLQISDINELYQEQYKLSHGVINPKTASDVKEKKTTPADKKPVELTIKNPPPLPQPSPRPTPEQKKTVVLEPPKKEETPKQAAPEPKTVKPPTPPSIEPMVEAKPATPVEEKPSESSGKEIQDQKPDLKPTPIEEISEKPKVAEKGKENSKPTDPKPAPTMGKIQMPPTKKAAEMKATEGKVEPKAQEKAPMKPAEQPKEVKKVEPSQEQPKPTDSKPADEGPPLPKLSQNPFLAKQSPPKQASPAPKSKPEAKTEAKPQLTDSLLSPQKTKEPTDTSMPPKSPRSTPVDDKINGLRSMWK